MPLHISSLPAPTSDLVVQHRLQPSFPYLPVLSHSQDAALLVPEEQPVGRWHEFHRSLAVLPQKLVLVAQLVQVQFVRVQNPVQDARRSRTVPFEPAGLQLLTQASGLLLWQPEPRTGVAQHNAVVQLEERGGSELAELGLLEALFVDFVEYSQVFRKGRAVNARENEGGGLQLHLYQQRLSRRQTLGQVFLLDFAHALDCLLPAEHAQPAVLALQVADHRVAVFLRGELQRGHPGLDFQSVALEVAPEFVEEAGLLPGEHEVDDQRGPFLENEPLDCLGKLLFVLALREGDCEGGVEVVEGRLAAAGRGGSDQRVDGVLLAVVGELRVEAHQRAEFVVDRAEQRALAGARDAAWREEYSVCVEGMPVQSSEIESPLSAQSELKPPSSGKASLTGRSSSRFWLISSSVSWPANPSRKLRRVLSASLDCTQLVRSRQSRQLVRMTPLCSLSSRSWVASQQVKPKHSITPASRSTSVSLFSNLLLRHSSWKSQNWQRRKGVSLLECTSSSQKLLSCRSSAFPSLSRFTANTRWYIRCRPAKCFVKAGIVRASGRSITISLARPLTPVCAKKAGTLPRTCRCVKTNSLTSAICSLSTKLATQPSSSMPRAQNLVPAFREDLRESRMQRIFWLLGRTEANSSRQPWTTLLQYLPKVRTAAFSCEPSRSARLAFQTNWSQYSLSYGLGALILLKTQGSERSQSSEKQCSPSAKTSWISLSSSATSLRIDSWRSSGATATQAMRMISWTELRPIVVTLRVSAAMSSRGRWRMNLRPMRAQKRRLCLESADFTSR